VASTHDSSGQNPIKHLDKRLLFGIVLLPGQIPIMIARPPTSCIAQPPNTAAVPPSPTTTPADATTSPVATRASATPLAVSSPDALLEALACPGTDIASIAVRHAVSLTALARWLAQPNIQDALDDLRALFALQHERWREQVTREAVDVLRYVMKSTDDAVERRRAAAAILRTLARTADPGQSRSAPPSVPPPACPPVRPRTGPTPAPAPAGPPSASGSDADEPPPKDPPEPFTDRLLVRLRARLPDRQRARAAVNAIWGGPATDTEAGGRTALQQGLDALLDALDGADIEPHPAVRLADGLHAERRITLRRPDGSTVRFLMRLFSGPRDAAWWLEAIEPLDSSEQPRAGPDAPNEPGQPPPPTDIARISVS
jgi:hypothetical protein